MAKKKSGLMQLGMNLLGIAGGAALGKISDKVLTKLPVVGGNPMLQNGAKVVAGGFFAYKFGNKNPMVQSVGLGVGGQGVYGLIREVTGGDSSFLAGYDHQSIQGVGAYYDTMPASVEGYTETDIVGAHETEEF